MNCGKAELNFTSRFKYIHTYFYNLFTYADIKEYNCTINIDTN